MAQLFLFIRRENLFGGRQLRSASSSSPSKPSTPITRGGFELIKILKGFHRSRSTHTLMRVFAKADCV